MDNLKAGIMFAVMLWLPASWLTHVIVTIMERDWLLLIAGAVFFPIGMIHGTGLWFNAW